MCQRKICQCYFFIETHFCTIPERAEQLLAVKRYFAVKIFRNQNLGTYVVTLDHVMEQVFIMMLFFPLLLMLIWSQDIIDKIVKCEVFFFVSQSIYMMM